MGGEHRCPVCDATFTRPQHVARHMRSHTGDRPYRCNFCPDQFARSDLLSRHVNKCHEAEKPLAGPPGRKGSRTALRATSSKQTCDQCVKASLSCDGAKPCARCTQRKVRCTFVEFNRQTAPAGPGHPDNGSLLPKTVSSLQAPASSPFSTTSLSRDHVPITAAPLFPSHPNTSATSLDLAYARPSDYPNTIRHGLHSWTGENLQQFYTWNQGLYHNTNADHDLQPFVSSISHRRDSLDYGGSVGSGSIPSSASSSSSHLPIEAIPMHQSFQLDTSFNTFNQTNSSSEDTQAPFNSAFGVLSIHDDNAAPFFSHLQQPEIQSQSGAILSDVMGTGVISDPNATPMAREDVNWSQIISTPANLSYATPTPTGFYPRRRATSMFTVRTPTTAPEAFLHHSIQPSHRIYQPPQQIGYGVVHPPIHAPVPVEDLSSWSAKIQSQRPPELRLAATKVKTRRQTLAGGERERERGSPLLQKVPAPGQDAQVPRQTSFAYRGSVSPVDPRTRSSSSSTSSWESTGTSFEFGMRPAFKRLPSATPLEHDRKHKRVLISNPVDNNVGSDCVVSTMEDCVPAPAPAPLDSNREHGNDGFASAQGMLPTLEVPENFSAEVERSTSSFMTHMANMTERRASVDAEGGDMTFGLQLGTH